MESGTDTEMMSASGPKSAGKMGSGMKLVMRLIAVPHGNAIIHTTMILKLLLTMYPVALFAPDGGAVGP